MTREQILSMTAGREMDEAIGRLLYPEAKSFIILPKYSTDISAAWEIIDKWQSEGRWASVSNSGLDGISVGNEKWICEVDCDDCIDYGSAETAPLAICRAALLLNWNNRNEARWRNDDV